MVVRDAHQTSDDVGAVRILVCVQAIRDVGAGEYGVLIEGIQDFVEDCVVIAALHVGRHVGEVDPSSSQTICAVVIRLAPVADALLGLDAVDYLDVICLYTEPQSASDGVG